MDKTVLEYVCFLESMKTAYKNIHWDARNMSQHKLLDDIGDAIDKFQDEVAEVEQSISGNLPFNELKSTHYEISTVEKFVNDIIDKTTEFYKALESKGDKYIGMRSDCESFLSAMQRNLYLLKFTVKEDFKRKVANEIRESMYKNIDKHENIDKLKGRKPLSVKARINQIYRLLNRYGLQAKRYSDDHWQAVDDYQRAIESLGCEMEVWVENGGYTDYDPSDNMPRSKEYKCRISYDDGMVIDGYMKMMACGTTEDPFSTYDTAIILWPKPKRSLGETHERAINEEALSSMLTEAVNTVLKRLFE